MVKMDYRGLCELLPSHDVLHRSPSSPSDVVDSSENGKFSPFYISLLVSIWKVYFYPARKIEKREGVFIYLATKKENGLGVTKIKVGGYSYTSSWAIHCKPMRIWPMICRTTLTNLYIF